MMIRLAMLAAGMIQCTGHYSEPLERPDGGNACSGALFDPCTSSEECESGLCKSYAGAGFSVCTEACTAPGTSSCDEDASGSAAFCNNMGLCKPVMPNGCAR
jgi:hypothetical protein